MSFAGVDERASLPSSAPACSLCRRRKLKCDKTAKGCKNCTKSNVTCIYPSPEPKPRGKRGPYSKNKMRQEQELKQTMKKLEDKCEWLENQIGNYGLPVNQIGAQSMERYMRTSGREALQPILSALPTSSSIEMVEGTPEDSASDGGLNDLQDLVAGKQESHPPNQFWSNFDMKVSR